MTKITKNLIHLRSEGGAEVPLRAALGLEDWPCHPAAGDLGQVLSLLWASVSSSAEQPAQAVVGQAPSALVFQPGEPCTLTYHRAGPKRQSPHPTWDRLPGYPSPSGWALLARDSRPWIKSKSHLGWSSCPPTTTPGSESSWLGRRVPQILGPISSSFILHQSGIIHLWSHLLRREGVCVHSQG